MSHHEIPNWMPTFRASRCGLWVVCDNMAMGRADDHLVTITHGPIPEGKAREKMAAGRALMKQELEELPPGSAFWLDVERAQPDGHTRPLGQALVMPAAFFHLEEPELENLLDRYTPQAILELWRISNAWYVLNPPEQGNDTGSQCQPTG